MSSSTRRPVASIGMPVFNGEKYLEDAIRSNLGQTFDDLELVISDNASTDRTETICRDYALKDSRVRYFRNDVNIGAAKNYNNAFQHSHGEFFRWSNADDMPAPELLEKTLEVLRERADVVIAYGLTQLVDADGNPIESYEDNMDLQQDDVVERYRDFFRRVGLTNIIYGLMRSSAVAKTRMMGNGKLPAGDINFMAAMILIGKFCEIPEVLFERRIHEEAFSSNPDPEAEASFWTGKSNIAKMPYWRSEFANIGATIRAPVSFSDRLSLFSYSARRLYWHRKQLFGDLMQLLSFRR